MMISCSRGCERKVRARGLCASCYDRWLRQSNPEFAERVKARVRKWHAANPEKVKENSRRYRGQPGVGRAKLARAYGLTEEEYMALVSKPCGLCGESVKPRYLDHDHDTGVNRGPLCHGCNLGLGFIEKRPVEWLEKALVWIGRKPHA